MITTIEKIKQYAQSIGFLFDENSFDKRGNINVTCPNNHITTVNYKNWQTNINKCQKCPKPQIERKKWKLYEIEDCFTNKGFELLSKSYDGYDTKLEYKCKNGHVNTATFGNFRKMTYGCKECAYKNIAKQNSLPFNVVCELFEKRGYTILITENEYTNGTAKINFKCDKGHITDTNVVALKNGHGCNVCSGNKKLTYEQVKTKFEEYGYTMISTTYFNARTQMEVKCQNGHLTSICYDDVTHSKGPSNGCKYCSGCAPCEYEDVKKAFENENYTLLSTEYINAHKHLEFVCPKGHQHKMSYTHFVSGKRCGICAESNGEMIIRKYLDKSQIPYEREKRFKQCKNKKYLPFDFYVDNKFIIEFDGIQHFTYTENDFFGGKERFAQCQLHDKIKTDFCFDYHIPLLRISYDCINDIPNLIDKFIIQIKKDKTAIKFSNTFLYEHLEYN
jgi:hypothetical protein